MRFALLSILMLGLLAGQGNESWRRPFPPHKIAGNLYYIGTEDLACFLITTPHGDTGGDGPYALEHCRAFERKTRTTGQCEASMTVLSARSHSRLCR
jgi:hypothetical protein